MSKANINIFASLLLAGFVAACGGGSGGGGGQTNNPQNNPPESSPESGAIDNQPVKSISVSTINYTSGKPVVAGQSFTINVKSNNGATATVKFANAVGNPSTITYTPSSCTLSAGGVCTSVAHVGLSTKPTVESELYSTSLVFANSNTTQGGSSINFQVTSPQLSVLSEPNPSSVTLGNSTSFGFSIADGSIPDEAGYVRLDLSSTNGLGNFTLTPTSCQISYAAKKIVENQCASVQALLGSQTGNTTIKATASNGYFTSAFTSNITSDPGTKPTIEIQSSLKNPSIIAGHSFTLTAISQNDATAIVSFTPTDPNIVLTPSSCTVAAGGSCSVKAMVKLGTPSNLHDIKVSYQSGSLELPDTKYRFKSETPVLVNQSLYTSTSLLKDKSSSSLVNISVPSASIPEGVGKITVNLSYDNSNVVSGPASCKIVYADGEISSNECDKLNLTAKEYGRVTITPKVSTADFENPAASKITVPKHIAYVLGNSSLAMLGNLDNGTLTAITNLKMGDLPVNPGKMQQQVIGGKTYLYMTDVNTHELLAYMVDADTGIPNQAPVSSAAIADDETDMVVSSSYIFVLNKTSVAVWVYKMDPLLNKLTKVAAQKVGTVMPTGIAITSDGKYLYVIGNKYFDKSILIKAGYLFGYQVAKSGSLSQVEAGEYNDLEFTAVGVDYRYNVLNIACKGVRNGVTSVWKGRLDTDGTVINKSADVVKPSGLNGTIINNLYFSPYSIDGSFYYAMTKSTVIPFHLAKALWNLGTYTNFTDSQLGTNTMAFSNDGLIAYIGFGDNAAIQAYGVDKLNEGGLAPLGSIVSNIVTAPLNSIVISQNY